MTYIDLDSNGIISSSEILKEQNYYPFGMFHKGYNNVSQGNTNNYRTYQAQEYTEDLGINVHEFKFRMHDPTIGKFWQIDPLAEDYVYNSPYAFQENKLGLGTELEGLELDMSARYNDLDNFAVRNNLNPLEVKQQYSTAVVKNTGTFTIGVASLFIPGPEDVAIAGFAATKVGGTILKGLSKFGDETSSFIKGLFSKGDNIVTKVDTPSSSATNSVKLEKQLASEEQLSESGRVIAGEGTDTPLRKAEQMAKDYGGEASDYVKKTSSSYTAKDGTKFETHWEENIKTGKRFNQKTKIDN